MLLAILTYPLIWASLTAAAEEEQEVRYLRLLPEKTEAECVFKMKRDDKGWSITSVTERNAAKLTVTARYDAQDVLLVANAFWSNGEQKKAAQVEVKDGQAKVRRAGKEAQGFKVPEGVIVTSAPDWTDTFLLCRRYERKKGGKQDFPALWIHPEQDAQRLTLSVEREGADAIEHEGRKVELDRYRLRIRNNSEYLAWADAEGRMVKLVALPVKEKGGTVLVLAGYEKSAERLRPSQR
jgi:hypothetical protein